MICWRKKEANWTEIWPTDGKPTWSRVVFIKDDLPVKPAELATLLVKLADRKFAKGRCSISASENGIAVEGDKEVIEWVTTLVKKLSEK